MLATVFDALAQAGEWVKANPAAAAEWHAPLIGLDAATVEIANRRRSYRLQAVDAPALDEQQRIADAFHAQQIIPRKVVVSASAVWRRQA